VKSSSNLTENPSSGSHADTFERMDGNDEAKKLFWRLCERA